MTDPLITPKVTVVFLLYNAAGAVPELFQKILIQKHPGRENQSSWLEVLFMNDHSADATQSVLERELNRHGNPSHYRAIENSKNLGLAATLNRAFELARSPFVLTCHCDAFFGHENYVSSMLALIESHPEAAAISGKPLFRYQEKLHFSEKMNLIANLMDIIPHKPSEQSEQNKLIPIGFAEGRCDIFRVDALRKVGFYNLSLRTSGEDQLMAARLRQEGYKIYQAPQLTYGLSVSTEQDSGFKIALHQTLYGKTHPYILFKNKGTFAGITGENADPNRKSRTILRLSQLLLSGIYFTELVFLARGCFILVLISMCFILTLKVILFRSHLRVVRLNGFEFLKFLAFQPLLDLAYTFGFIQGIGLILNRSGSSQDQPI